MDPIEHYLAVGHRMGRNPSRSFDTEQYLRSNPDLRAGGMNPLLHFIRFGRNDEGVEAGDGLHALEQAERDLGRAASADRAVLPRDIFAEWMHESVFCRKLLGEIEPAISTGLIEALRVSEASLARLLPTMESRATQPLVSIVMPTFNRAPVIAEAIQSVVEQTNQNWELLVCDDGSDDATEAIVSAVADARIQYLKLEKAGAAAARNAGLSKARGEVIAYLDSDNQWHPCFLSRMVLALLDRPGRSAAYADYIDYRIDRNDGASISSFARPAFSHERLLARNYIDLNSFVHRRELYDCFGGFNVALRRLQDYDLVLKYTWLRDPIHVREILALYQRNDNFSQISTAEADDQSSAAIIDKSVAGYLKQGLPLQGERPVRSVTILSWDMSRNHFSKPFALAEALSVDYDVQLISFRFFDEKIFAPLKDVKPPFETLYLPGSDFPDFFETMEKAIAAVRGDVIYVVKPRLPSLGVALLANHRNKVPVILEVNDLETVIDASGGRSRHMSASLDSVDMADGDLLNPYGELWSHLMEPLVDGVPTVAAHNVNLDAHFGNRCLSMRNPKDEAVYDPQRYDRASERARLGFGPDDRVILFGGMIRKHKGVHELVELVERLADPRYRLLFVGSRPTPDQSELVERYGTRITLLPPQDREAMARINLAADLVILWLDPGVPVSHYQMPYKATDALAMGPAIVANPISDLAILGRQGYLHLVPFGDWETVGAVIGEIFADPRRREQGRAAGRRLFLRQFSYAAARGNFELALHRALSDQAGALPVAEAFAQRFDEFHREVADVDSPSKRRGSRRGLRFK